MLTAWSDAGSVSNDQEGDSHLALNGLVQSLIAASTEEMHKTLLMMTQRRFFITDADSLLSESFGEAARHACGYARFARSRPRKLNLSNYRVLPISNSSAAHPYGQTIV